MAHVHIPDQRRRLDDAEEISAFLAPFGIFYEKWNVERGVSPDASAEEILTAYAPEVAALQQRGGYVTADVLNVTPDTPGLDEMVNRFNKEHTHSEDEVRFCIKGRGLFHIHPPSGPVFAIEVEAGDLINVPAGTQHWFDLCGERSIRAIRLFRDPAGWAPAYIDEGVHQRDEPLCFGPKYIPYGGPQIDPLVKV